MAEYDDLLAVWYKYATLDHCNPMCVSFTNERDAIRDCRFFQSISLRLHNLDYWRVIPQENIEDNPASNEKKGDMRYFVMCYRGK